MNERPSPPLGRRAAWIMFTLGLVFMLGGAGLIAVRLGWIAGASHLPWPLTGAAGTVMLLMGARVAFRVRSRRAS